MKTVTGDRSKIRSLIAEAEHQLAEGPHSERARMDAQALLLHILKRHGPQRNLAWLIAHSNSPTMPSVGTELRALVERRLAGEPIQYIAGEAEFYRMPFFVNRDVLIPRPETEHLVEKVVELAPTFHRPRIVDVGTGSGAIAIALAHEWPDAVMTATDISDAALRLARQNAERLGFADRVRFLQGDLLLPVAGEQFDIVVSNPPYVAERDRETLSVEVRDYEPAQALFAGEDGLAIYRQLIPAAWNSLVASGFVVLEIGFGQADPVRALLADAGFSQVEFAADLQGIPRVVSARRC